MHDFLIAMTFVAMVLGPCLLASAILPTELDD